MELSLTQALQKAIEAQKSGRGDEARQLYLVILKAKPTHPSANFNMGMLVVGIDKLHEALPFFKAAYEAKPANAQFVWGYVVALVKLGYVADAKSVFKLAKASGVKSDVLDQLEKQLNALKSPQSGEYTVESFWAAIKENPKAANNHYNLARALHNGGDLIAAIENYKQAIKIRPDYIIAHDNLALALKSNGNLDGAIKAHKDVLKIKPDYADAYYNMGNALKDKGDLDASIESYKQAIKIKPDYEAARAAKLFQQATICDWAGIEEDRHLIPELGTLTQHFSPFRLLSLEDAPDRHRLRSEIYAKKTFKNKKLIFSSPALRTPDRLRVGYISADFREHPLSYLLIRTLELHNRDHFNIYAYSCHDEDIGKMRERIKNAVDVFVDIRKMSDQESVKRIQKDEIDILIDLSGYTDGGRSNIFQYHPAPIQINYIGYPGTMGADFIDYLMADRTLIPDEMQQYYREKIIYLPNCYQPNDNTRVISDKVLTKLEMGLPDDGFVFCCFNNSYKITPAEFDIWMRLLGKVDKSVLWLLSSNKWAEKNLKEAASIRGISSDRIVFAQKLPQADHLARLQLADLFLDTFNYNAGATATDALWSGLPLITKMGQGYTARMAGSILSSVGLSELAVTTEAQYEELALRLATTPGELIQIREKLVANRLTTPLFDSELFTRHLENGYRQAYELYFEGKSPDHVYVPA